MFSHTYETRYGDYKDFDEIKVGTLLDFVQDVSIRDSEHAGFGIHYLKELNLAWLMQGINLKINKPIKTIQPVEVATAVKSLNGATSERGCLIIQEGEVIAKTVANWFLFNSEKNKIARVLPEMQEAYDFADFKDDFFSYVKPPVLEIKEAVYSVRVSNKDIDTNMHLNNQKSADMLMDALPFDFSINDMKILYKKPAFLGDELQVCMQELEKGYYVHLQTEQKEICVIGTFETI